MNHSKPRSRRKFLASVVAANVAANIAAADKGQPAAPTNDNAKRKNGRSKKLGPVAGPTDQSKFSLRRRIPGWHSDVIGQNEDDNERKRPSADDDDEHLFLEEAIGRDKTTGKFKYFPPPMTGGKHFQEPSRYDTYQRWHDFNKWILGEELKAPRNPDNKDREFHALLTEIAARVRVYNAALHWMRRLHFRENTPPGSPETPYNENGDKRRTLNDLDPKSNEFAQLAIESEREWKAAVKALDEIVSPKQGGLLKFVSVDFLEINSYIVSMRVVADSAPFHVRYEKDKDSPISIRELGGSSSSHNSISSAFCSGCR